MATSTTLYDRVVEVTTSYLGPAAERFLERQIRTHLHKKPRSITRSDLSKLIDWIRLAMSLLTEDILTVDEYIKSLEKLAAKPTKRSHAKR